MWTEFHYTDGSSVFVNMSHIVSVKSEGDKDNKTILVTHSGWAFWVRESPMEIMRRILVTYRA